MSREHLAKDVISSPFFFEDAGRLLLHPEPVQFNGRVLALSEDTGPANAKAPASAGGMFVPRTAASRPRAGIGSTKKAKAPSAAASASSSGKQQDDFRKMLS